MAKDSKQTATKIVRKTGRHSREIWRITSSGKVKNITTRNSSTKAMDEAMVIYSSALKRLADR